MLDHALIFRLQPGHLLLELADPGLHGTQRFLREENPAGHLGGRFGGTNGPRGSNGRRMLGIAVLTRRCEPAEPAESGSESEPDEDDLKKLEELAWKGPRQLWTYWHYIASKKCLIDTI